MTRREFVKHAGVWVPAAAALIALPERARAAVTYFGHNVDEATSWYFAGYSVWNHRAGGNSIVWTCPGTGSQPVSSLGALVKVASAANLRIAIYTQGDDFGDPGTAAFLMQGSAEIAVSETSLTWKTHTSFVDVNGDPITSPTLTGGTNYLMMATSDGGSMEIGYGATTGYTQFKTGADYTAGFPATDPSYSGAVQYEWCIRCGVGTADVPAGPRRRVQLTL
jgi:hypothetical protein